MSSTPETDNTSPSPRGRRASTKNSNAPKGLPRPVIAAAIMDGEMTPSQAARHWGCARATIYGILDQYGASRKRLDAYRGARADVLADIGLKATGLLHKLIDNLCDGDVVNGLQPGQYGGLIAATTTLLGVVYDKERLERGQSTANISSLLQVAQQRADAAYCGAHGADTDCDIGNTDGAIISGIKS